MKHIFLIEVTKTYELEIEADSLAEAHEKADEMTPLKVEEDGQYQFIEKGNNQFIETLK